MGSSQVDGPEDRLRAAEAAELDPARTDRHHLDRVFWDRVSRCMARNQRDRPSLVALKMVPAMALHLWRLVARWKYNRPWQRIELLWPQPHSGQTNPAGQRYAISTASHWPSLP
jgi:hypothetical protein